MKILINERMTARRSCLESLGKPDMGMYDRFVLRLSPALHEFPALKGVMSLARCAAKTAIALSWMISAPVWAASGYVYDAVGEVSATVGKNAAQHIAKNAAIIPNTIINTGDKSYAVLKFEDGQVITLQSNSTFHVRKYHFDPKQLDQSSAVFSMFKGGMRFVTGLIGQRNKKSFRLATPNATIGIRGTEFMVALVNGAVYSQVVSGGIRLTNDAGTAVFSAGQAAIASSAKSIPTAISITDLPAGTFTQLETISAQPAALVPQPAGGTAAASTPAPEIPAAIAPSAPAAGPAIAAAADAAPAAATGDAERNAAAAAVRDEAAAGLFGKHNFTATGIATGEICAFCHAPQGIETKVTAPLWNRSRSPLSDYQAYSTLGSATAAASGSVSIACLSCHDGTQAPNVVINTPGKDGTDADSINGAKTDSSLFLKSHHPVGMPYAGGGPNHAIPGAPFKLEDFRSTAYTGSDTGTVWWVDRGGNGRQKTDLLLFTRTDTPDSGSMSQPYVECASCHDPHNISTPTFLRATNAGGSGLCLTCHAK